MFYSAPPSVHSQECGTMAHGRRPKLQAPLREPQLQVHERGPQLRLTGRDHNSGFDGPFDEHPQDPEVPAPALK